MNCVSAEEGSTAGNDANLPLSVAKEGGQEHYHEIS